MKSIGFAVLALSAAFASAHLADPAIAQTAAPSFDGPYVGAALGADMVDPDGRYQLIVRGVPVYKLDFHNTATGVVGGLYGGYGFTFGQFYIGGEGEFMWSDASSKLSQGFNARVGGVTVPYNVNFRMRYTAELTPSLQFGYLALPNVMPFGRFGWSFDHARLGYGATATAAAIPVGTNEQSRWLDGPRVGVGVDWLLLPQLRLRLEYDHTWLSSFTVVGAVPSLAAVANNTRVEPQQDTVHIGIAWQF
jgi:opacity protein-like surface antigen